MRINIYQEEITGELELVTKENVVGEDGNLTTFYGVRIFLLTHDVMHHNEHDDDRNAITFWTRDKANAQELLGDLQNRVLFW